MYIDCEGIIKSKLEIRKSKFNKGYTLVEMVVVMGIIAIITLIGASALVLVRDQYVLDQVVENIITQTRDAQNKSISIQKDQNGNTIKVWGVNFGLDGPTQLTVFGKHLNGTTVQHSTISNETLPNGVSFTGSGKGVVYFAAPFGKSYILAGGTCPSSSWTVSSKETHELEPSSCVTSSSPITITVQYKNQTRSLTILTNGDISAN